MRAPSLVRRQRLRPIREPHKMESCHQNLCRSSGSARCASMRQTRCRGDRPRPSPMERKTRFLSESGIRWSADTAFLANHVGTFPKGEFTIEQVVEKMCHAPATLYRIDRRGYLRSGYYADIVVVDPCRPYTVTIENILSKCKWSPFEGHTFPISIDRTFVNGNEVFSEGKVCNRTRGKRLTFHDNPTQNKNV